MWHKGQSLRELINLCHQRLLTFRDCVIFFTARYTLIYGLILSIRNIPTAAFFNFHEFMRRWYCSCNHCPAMRTNNLFNGHKRSLSYLTITIQILSVVHFRYFSTQTSSFCNVYRKYLNRYS